MSYIYDIVLNFKQDLYEFYDWNTKDTIIHIRKIPLIKVSSKTMEDIKQYIIQFDSNFLESIKNKTEMFQNKQIVSLKQSFILSDGFEAVALVVYKDKNKISRLQVEEELEVLDEVSKLKETNIKYQKIKKRYVQMYKTRKELKLEQYLKLELKKLEQGDIIKLQYLYFECFLEEEKSRDKMIERFYFELNNNFNFISEKLLSFFKLVS